MSAQLRAYFRGQLTPEILAFMDDIEAQSGMQIDVVHQPPGDTAAMGMRCLEGKIQIEIPVTNAIHMPAALHELQHMERYLVHGVPAMGAVYEADQDLVGRLENPIEHLVIVPQASKWSMREQDFWNAQIRNGWINLPNSGPGYLYSRQQMLRLNWLATSYATDAGVIALAESMLAAEGKAEEAETRDLREEAFGHLDDKIELTRIITAGLGIASHRVQLQIFDKGTGKFTRRPLS